MEQERRRERACALGFVVGLGVMALWAWVGISFPHAQRTAIAPLPTTPDELRVYYRNCTAGYEEGSWARADKLEACAADLERRRFARTHQ